MEEKKKIKKWFDNECEVLKHNVRRIGKQKHENPHNHFLKTKYHEKLKEYKNNCKSKRYHFWKKQLEDIEHSISDPKAFWEKWKKIGEIYVDRKSPDIKGEKWYNHFSNLHNIGEETNELPIPEKSKTDNVTDEPFTKKEFMNVISNLKNNKTIGYDSISNEMIKNSPETVLDLLLKFINLCLRQSLIPHSWCRDLITPIFKDGVLDDPNNYRGICISSVLLKIVCSLLQNRIQAHCDKFNIINSNQIGFKSHHRTADHLFTLKALVKKYVTIGEKKLFACFVDFKKAFDSIWHEGLFHKISNYGITGNLLNFIRNIYKKTNCAVKVGDRITSFFPFTKGVRQGCPMSPILFNLYINDIFGIANNGNEIGLSLEEGTKINALMYADDLILLSETKEGLQTKLDKLKDYCDKWQLDVNIKKTKVMIFNRGNKLIKSNINYKNVQLQNVKYFKYLGFTISAKNCNFGPTIEDLSVKAKRTIFALNNQFKISKLPKKLAMKLFNSLITPILLYGSEVWGPYMDYDYLSWESSNVERVQTQFLKRILGCNIQTSNLMVRGETGVRPLLLNIIKKVINYTNSVKQRPHSTVFSAFNFELNNDTSPNFSSFVKKFDLECNTIYEKSKNDLNKLCVGNYDRFWWTQINNSSKASSYITFKRNICYENYLDQIKNEKHRTTLSRFRLSNHDLLIEKGRHTRPKLERNDRKCFICKDEIEDECHFVIKCPLYTKERQNLFNCCRDDSKHFDSQTSEEKFKFIFLNENPQIFINLAKFIFESQKSREMAKCLPL